MVAPKDLLKKMLGGFCYISFLFGGQVFLDVTDFESLEKTLGEACFKFEYRPPATELSCDAKSAILMKYLTERF